MVANHRTKGQSADSSMLVIGQNNSGDRATATTKAFQHTHDSFAREVGRLSFQEEDFHALWYVSNHSLHPFHNQDERISFYPLRCIDHLLFCSGQVSKSGRKMTSSRRAYVLLALSPTNGSKHCLPLAGDG